jgi:hypothetical protein
MNPEDQLLILISLVLATDLFRAVFAHRRITEKARKPELATDFRGRVS